MKGIDLELLETRAEMIEKEIKNLEDAYLEKDEKKFNLAKRKIIDHQKRIKRELE